jgi:hypothetical protein
MLPQIVASKTDVQLQPAPIEASWILEGRPSADSAELFQARTGALRRFFGSAHRVGLTGRMIMMKPPTL